MNIDPTVSIELIGDKKWQRALQHMDLNCRGYDARRFEGR
jgi:hypothetical protein